MWVNMQQVYDKYCYLYSWHGTCCRVYRYAVPGVCARVDLWFHVPSECLAVDGQQLKLGTTLHMRGPLKNKMQTIFGPKTITS